MAGDEEVNLLSLMDLLDIEESVVDQRLQGIMSRCSFTVQHLKRASLLLQYKVLLNSYDDVESDNRAEVDFAIQLLAKSDDTTTEYTCKIVNLALLLNKPTIEFKAQHIVQQLLCDLDFTSVAKVNEIDKRTLLFRLKVLDNVLNAVMTCRIKILMFNEIPLENIIYSDSEEVRNHFVTSTIVHLIEAVEGMNILDRIWNSISTCDVTHEKKALIVLSSLSDYYLPMMDSNGVVKYKSAVVRKQEFWTMILRGLQSQDSFNRKFSLYLAKRGIDCVTNEKRNITIFTPGDKEPLLSWNTTEAKVLEESWKCFFLLLEILEEKQGNIVRDSLFLFQQISNIDRRWRNCAFEIALKHPNLTVLQTCIEYKVIGGVASVDEAKTLLDTLNNIHMFDDSKEARHVKILLKKIFSETSQLKYYLKAFNGVKWLPIPLFYLAEMLADLKLETQLWNDLSKEEFTSILCNIVRQPCNNVIIGKAIHCSVVNLTLTNCKEIGAANFAEIMSTVRCDFSESSKISHKISTMMESVHESYTDCKKEFWNIISQYSAIDIPLMYLRCHPDEINFYLTYLEDRFDRIKDLNSRPYSSKDECNADFVYIVKLIKKLEFYECSFGGVHVIHNFIKTNVECLLNYVMDPTVLSQAMKSDHFTSYLEQCRCVFSLCSPGNIIEMFSQYLPGHPKEQFTNDINTDDKNVLWTKINATLTRLKTPNEDIFERSGIDGEVKFGKLRNHINEVFCKLLFNSLESVPIASLLPFLEEMIDNGGDGCLLWVLKAHKVILPRLCEETYSIEYNLPRFMERAWKEICELRSNAQCKPNMKEFVAILLQDCLLKREEYHKLIKDYCTKILEYGSVSNVPLYFVVDEILQKGNGCDYEPLKDIFSVILLFGRGSCRDRSTTDSAVRHIRGNAEFFFGVDLAKCDYYFDSEIRNKATKVLLQNTSPLVIGSLTTEMLNKVLAIFQNKSRYHGNSQPHRSLLRALQHILFMSVICPEGVDLDHTVSSYIHLLEKLPHQPSVRIFMEIFIAYYIIIQKFKMNEETLTILKQKTIPLPSVFNIMYMVMKKRLNGDANLIIDEYTYTMDFLLSYTMGQVFNIRLNAQYFAWRLYKIAAEKSMDIHMKYNQVFQIIERTFEDSKNEKNLIKLQNCYFINRFDVIENLTPKCIYYFIPKYNDVQCDEIMEYDEIPSIDDCVKYINDSSKANIDLCQIWLKADKIELASEEVCLPSEVKEISTNEVTTIQKKYIPWSNMFHGEEASLINAQKKVKNSGLIVVASLIDKLPNLGGLARTSEVFGVKKYVIDNLQHIQDKQFQGLSVSAEKWVEMEQVKPGQQLKEYLRRMKAEGYTLVAAEQTSSSVSLEGFRFPHNTVLILGHEKEGVPCDLLTLMDHCVEIPQKGFVRSLNVHVTAAIFVWEYVRQNLLSAAT